MGPGRSKATAAWVGDSSSSSRRSASVCQAARSARLRTLRISLSVEGTVRNSAVPSSSNRWAPSSSSFPVASYHSGQGRSDRRTPSDSSRWPSGTCRRLGESLRFQRDRRASTAAPPLAWTVRCRARDRLWSSKEKYDERQP